MFEGYCEERQTARREGRAPNWPKGKNYYAQPPIVARPLFKGTCSPAMDNSVPRGDRDDLEENWN